MANITTTYRNITSSPLELTATWNATPCGNSSNYTATGILHQSYFNQWNYLIRYYGLFVCLCIGVIGNGTSFLIFVTSKLRRGSTGIYLISLSWVDTLVLVTELLARMNVLAISDVSCKLIFYFRYSFKLLEALIVVTLCADRTACLLFPFQSHKFANAKTAIEALCVTTLVSFALCVYALFSIILWGASCNVTYLGPSMLYNYVDIIISVIIGEVLTSLLVIIMAAYIIKALAKLNKVAKKISLKRKPQGGIDRQVTRMTAAVALTFTITRLPYSLVYVTFWVRHYVLLVPWDSATQQNLTAAADFWSVIALLNYCLNFLIYVTFWQAFRKKFVALVKCSGEKRGWKRSSGSFLSSRRSTEMTGLYGHSDHS